MWVRSMAFLRRCQVAWSGLLLLSLLSSSLQGLRAQEGGGSAFIGDRVVDAINCGGPEHTDSYGVHYREDNNPAGTASDHGKRFLIGRVPPADQILYQTERYHLEDFSYTFKVPEEGNYVLVLKFSEVYFTAPYQKVFDINVNNIPVISDLDIFARVGRGVAHDELVPFTIKNGELLISGTSLDFTRKLTVTFIKGAADNPKVNAIYIYKGTIDGVPKLAEVKTEEEEEEEESSHDHYRDDKAPGRMAGETEEEAAARRAKLASGPKTPDPYSTQDQSQMLIPILVVVLAFFPVLFCLCKL